MPSYGYDGSTAPPPAAEPAPPAPVTSGEKPESTNVGAGKEGRVVVRLAELPAQTLLDEHALAEAIGVTARTIRRMARRGELPPGVPFGGRTTWIVGQVLAHVEERAKRAAQTVERRVRCLGARSRERAPPGSPSGKKEHAADPPNIATNRRTGRGQDA